MNTTNNSNDNNDMTSSSSSSSSSTTDSDDDSILSAIFNNTQTLTRRNDEPNVFTFATPQPLPPVGSYAIASCVYVLIDEGKFMSADMRLMWYLKRLGTVQKVDEDLGFESPEQCRIMSFLPKEEDVKKSDFEKTTFVMDSLTRVYFLTALYNMVYCLDMSPSNCSVDMQRGYVMLDEMIVALSRSIEGFIRPFIVPGSNDIVFEPKVYVTVIVHTPFYTSLAQQVLVQGWLINKDNFNEFIQTVTLEMNRLENALAKTKIIINKTPQSFDNISLCENDVMIDVYENQDQNLNNIEAENHNSEINSDENVPIGNNSPDSGFINTLRYGMLAVRLLPCSSISNLIVITDGMITLADIQVLDSVLNQLRCIGVACSFMHVSSQFHPNSCHGHVPYSELMQFISTATSGTYLNSFPITTHDLVVNYYHDKFIMWSFKRGNGKKFANNTTNISCTPIRVRPGEWTVKNSNFYGNRLPQLVSKKQINDHVQAHLDNIVCCRMREGFLIEDIQFKDAGSPTTVLNMNNTSKLQLKFILPWTNHIYIEYDLIVKWPPPIITKVEPIVVKKTSEAKETSTPAKQETQESSPAQPDGCLNIHYTVVVKGPYEFLHDITCNKSKKSQLQLQLPGTCQFQLSSCRSSSISVTAATTTITKNSDLLPEISTDTPTPRIVASKYRQALINRFWSTMRSIVQTDLLIKHLETYSPSTGHLFDYNSCHQNKENLDRQQQQKYDNQPSPQVQQINDSNLSPNILNNNFHNTDGTSNTGTAEAQSTNFSKSGVPNRSPLRSGMPLFYHLPTNSNTSFSLKQNQVKLNDQQQSYTDQQHQQFADFWKPVCTLDPDSQWPKWFSTYRIGGGVLLLRHDKPLPRLLHMANTVNGRYQTMTCRKAAESLFALLKQWCTFVLIDEHSYVKCLDRSETHTGNVSFCIARISLRPPSCCCVVLHLAFQSCVPASVHHEIIDDLKTSIQFLDSTTAVKPLSSIDNTQLLTNKKKKKIKIKKKKESKQLAKNKSKKPQRYVYLLDKPLEKILIRYERIPSQFTTVIFPDGSQPYPAPTVPASIIKNSNSKSNVGKRPDTSHEHSATGVELKTVTTTTTLSRYLYHRRWIWSSGRNYYSNSISKESQNLELQLTQTLSVLTKIRLREGFKFAHSSAGIINMVLQVDMIEGSPSCPTTTPTSRCVIQYVIFPPNILHKCRQKDHEHGSVVDVFKKKSSCEEKLSTTLIEEQKNIEKHQTKEKIDTLETGTASYCYPKCNDEDDYQLIMECWIEPQHGSVVVNKNQRNSYMSGLAYEQLADAIWQVDSDCINSLYTFQHMLQLCSDSNISISDTDTELDKTRQENKTIIIDDGRIYKLPFTLSLVNLLPKCRHYSSMSFSLFTTSYDTDTDIQKETSYSVKDEKKLNKMLELSFYSRLKIINDRSFDVSDSNSPDIYFNNSKQFISKLNDQDIGQCFVKRINDTRLILTVAPSFIEENSIDNSSEDSLQPCSRSRANTWHYTKWGVGQSLSSQYAHSQESGVNYYRTMSVGSKRQLSNSSTDMSWAKHRLDRHLCSSDTKDDVQNSYSSEVGGGDLQDFPTNMFIEVYDCRKEDVVNILMSDNHTYDQSVIDDYADESSSCCSSTSSKSDENEEENEFFSSKKNFYFDQPVDPMLLDKYLNKIQVVYDRSLVNTVFHALHLGLNVQYSDVQRAVDHCQHRLISFDITDYIKVVCDHFKNNINNYNTICPADNKALKSHHDMIHSTFSSTLDRHMIKPVINHPDYYFYDLNDKIDYDNCPQERYYMDPGLSSNFKKKNYISNILMEQQDLFPLFVHLVCTIKTNNHMSKSRSVRSLPTCIIELLAEDDAIENCHNMDLSDLKVSLDVYCLMLPNNDYEEDEEYEDDRFNKKNSSDKLHLSIINNSATRQSEKLTDNYENPFVYLNSSLPLQHAQGLAAFIAEMEWCMRDEMAAGLLKDSTVTPETLEKVIKHISSSPHSSSNEHQKLIVHFVVPAPGLGPSKYNSTALFLQKLHQKDMILNLEDGDGVYNFAKSTNDTFYMVKKNLQANTSSEKTEDLGDTFTQCTSECRLVNVENPKLMLPNFWIILKIQANQPSQKENSSDTNNVVNTLVVNVYFHCRFTELDVQGKYSALREVVARNVLQTAKIVNQSILLCRLYETRVCDPLLEPIVEDLLSHSDDDENDNSPVEKKITNYFNFGQFRCPAVWSTRFSLHPRLQHSTSMLLLGVQVLHTVLDKFSVRNRRNMFVYKDSSGSVFYLGLSEHSSQYFQPKNNMDPLQYDTDDEDSISRCSSATSTTATVSSSIFPSSHSNFSRKFSEDLNYMEGKAIQTPGARSLGGYMGEFDVDYLLLKVHGISPVGTEIRIDLVEVLQNRLNDAVLEVLTTMLYRNPICRLYPDDVCFIQPLDGHADYTTKLSVPAETKITKLFAHNLKRNAAALLLYPPKYASRHHKFNYIYDELDDSEKSIIRSFFIYNQPCGGTGGMRGTSGNRGLACILYDIYSTEANSSIDNLYDYPTDSKLFERRIQVTCIEDDMNPITDYSGYVKLFAWRRGRVNMEALQTKLTSIVTYSLWDIYIEQFLWEQPLIIEEPSETFVNPLCINYLTKWIAFGASKSVPLARHSHIYCRILLNHALREFKTNLSWSGTSKSLPMSIRYFYVPRTQYGQSGSFNTNVMSSIDPLQLDSSINNFKFHEWKISDTNSVTCPPSAAYVLIIMSVTSMARTKQKHQYQNQNKDQELSNSDSDNAVVTPDDDKISNTEEGNTNILNNNDQLMTSINNLNDCVKQSTVTDIKTYQKQPTSNLYDSKVNKLLLLAISDQSVHTLSYNCHKNDDQQISIRHLSRWLEWRCIAFTSSIYHMMGLKCPLKTDQFGNTKINSCSPKISNDKDLLLNYKNYVAVVEENELCDKVTIEKTSRLSNRTKPNDNDTNDNKNKSIEYDKDVHDLYIEELVRNNKQQRRIGTCKLLLDMILKRSSVNSANVIFVIVVEIYHKMLYDMWIQGDTIITKDSLRAFYHNSRLLHYCLTPLLFLPRWRLESAATRDHLLDGVKTRNSPSVSPPRWHKRLCTRLASAYAHCIQTNPLFTGFQPIHISKQRSFNDSMPVEMDYTKPTTCYFKKSVPGATGGLLLLETGVCQPFYYVKLSCVERSSFTNQTEFHEDKFKTRFSLLDQSENITRNMHLHSFTYDFHVRILSDRLSKLVQKQKIGKRINDDRGLAMLLEHRKSIQSNVTKSGSGRKKNSIAGFLDDFLKYYNEPPLYSSCLVLAGVIKRTKISVSGIQLYEYLLKNCSEDCEGMAVIKICDSSLVDGDDGASLFDDDEDEFLESQNLLGNDLTDFILVHHMAGSDIQQRQKSEMNLKRRKLGVVSTEIYTDCQFEVCGLYDATLIMTLSSVKKLLLDTSNEITLSYYVLLTNNENNNLEKKEKATFKTNSVNIKQRHSTPIRPSVYGHDQINNFLLSASVPSSSLGNDMTTESFACWGSLDENYTNNSFSETPPCKFSPNLKKKNIKSRDHLNDDFNNQTIKKNNLIKFYEKKAAELVAHTVDTAANRCRIHLLWQKFNKQFDQEKHGCTAITINELEELVNRSGSIKPLGVYDKRLEPLIEELFIDPQWFTSLHKLISEKPSILIPWTLPTQCRIYNSNNSDHHYLVVIINHTKTFEKNAFIIIDSGVGSAESIVSASNSLINIVFRRNVIGSEEVNTLVETVGKAICYHIWREVATGSCSTINRPSQ